MDCLALKGRPPRDSGWKGHHPGREEAVNFPGRVENDIAPSEVRAPMMK